MRKIKEDLKYLKGKFDVVIFGSYAKGEQYPSSDIDIAVITHIESESENIEVQKSLFGKFDPIYDLRVFELFPIDIKISIIRNYEVLFGDDLDISEYFYKYRKRWEDVKNRIFSNQFKDFRERMRIRKQYLEGKKT